MPSEIGIGAYPHEVPTLIILVIFAAGPRLYGVNMLAFDCKYYGLLTLINAFFVWLVVVLFCFRVL